MPKCRMPMALLLASTAFFAASAHAHAQDVASGSHSERERDAGKTSEVELADIEADLPSVDTPESVSVVTVDRFEAMGALNLQDALRYASGIRTEVYGIDPRGDYGFIRGIEAQIYQDGLRLPFGYPVSLRPELFTLSRIEVLRGPSQMLYGQGSTGGLLNLVTKRPESELQGEIFGSYGSFDTREFGFDVTGPIAGDQLTGRVTGLWRDGGSQTDFVSDRRWMLNASLSWQIGEDTNLTLIGLAQDDDSGWAGQFLPLVGTLYDAPNGKLPNGTQLGEPSTDRLDVDAQWIAADFSHQVSHVVEFRQKFRYQWFNTNQALHYADVYSDPASPYVRASDPYLNVWFPEYAALGDSRVLNRRAYGEVSRSKVLSSDTQFQIDFTTGELTHTLLAGADYMRNATGLRNADGYSGAGAFDANGLPILSLAPSATPVDAYAPVYGNVTPFDFRDDARQVQEQLGLYLQGQTRAFDIAIIQFGIRRDRVEDRATGSKAVVHNATTFRGGVMVDLGHGLLPYISYSESFLPINDRDGAGNPYLPQRGKQFEVGLKWQPDAATLVTFATYEMKDLNRLRTDPFDPFDAIQAGEVRTRGFEAEASKTIADNFDIVASYSYARARDRSNGNLQIESVPRHLASIWGMKYVPLTGDLGMQLGAGVRYVDESISPAAGGDLFVTNPDYILADALVALDRGPWSLTLNATNLFDKKYYTTCLGRGDCFVGLRRTVNATLGFRF